MLSCTFANDIPANTAYGLEMVATNAVGTLGSYAPITMETRMNNAADAGPVMDVNRVFDVMAMAANASPIGMTV